MNSTIRNATKRTRSDWFYWGLVLLGLICVGLLNFSIIHTDALATDRSGYDWREYMIYELGGATLTFPLMILLVALWNRFPIYENWLARLPIYLIATVAAGAAHTTLMLMSRSLLFPILLERQYQLGNLGYRYLMEFHKQAVWIWMTFGSVFIIQHIRNHQQNKIRAERLQSQLANARLDQMRQQINPHFLFNSLNLISSKVYQDPETADQLISDLSDLLRESLDISKQTTISLQSELDFLNKYLSIMQSRFPENITITRSIHPDCMDLKIPSLILQPIVENSFKHQLERRQGTIHITIECAKLDDQLQILISDAFTPASDFVSSARSDATKSTGTGLNNIKQRLQCMYGEAATMEYKAIDDLHFQTKILLPLTNKTASHA